MFRRALAGLLLVLVVALLPWAGARLVHAAYGGLTPQASGTTDTLRGVACPSRAVCYAVGDHGRIVATANGGRTWRTQHNPLSGLTDLSAIACPAVHTCVVAGGYMVAAAGSSGYFPPAEGAILVTTDGGHTWQQRRSHLGYIRLTGVACRDVAHCTIVGDQGSVLVTADGGRTWTTGASATHRELYAVSCTRGRGWACAAVGVTGAAAASADGGRSWTSSPSGVLADLNGVACPDPRTCVAVGASGAILRSTTGGQSWAAAVTPFAAVYTKPILSAVACASGTCYAVGAVAGHSTFAGSADGGRTWTDLGGSTSALLFGVSCPDAHTCVAVGAGGAILRTTAATPGAPDSGAAGGGASRGGQSGSLTLDKVVISDTPGGPQTYIMHHTATEYFTAYYHASARGATGVVALSENGTSLGRFTLQPGTAPDGSSTLWVALTMSRVPPGSISAQFTLRLGAATATQATSSLLLAD